MVGYFDLKSSGANTPRFPRPPPISYNCVFREPVASLGWVTPGAATEGVTPHFFQQKPGDLFAHCCSYHYRFLLLSLGCHSPRGCHPTPFLPVEPRISTILCKFAHKKFFPSDVTPEGCHPGRSPPRVTRGP